LDPFKRHRLRYRLREIVFFLLYLLLRRLPTHKLKRLKMHDSRASKLSA
jgi:hypothetical protein